MSLLDDVSIAVTPNGYKAGELYAVVPVPTEGSELITNGDFATDSDWTKGTGWTIGGGVASCDGSQSGTSNFYQTTANLSGKIIRMAFTVTNYSAGHIDTSFFGASGTLNPRITANGNYIFDIFIKSGHNGNTGFSANSLFVGSIDNVSVKEYTSADMDVTRATAATRVDEAGLVNYAEIIGSELVVNGDFATDTDWTKGTGWSISGGKAIFSGSNFANLEPSTTIIVVGNTYKLNLIAEVNNGSFKVQNTGNPDLITESSSGTYSVVFTATSTSLTIARATVGSQNDFTIDNISVKEVTRDNVPRIDYTGGEDILGSEEVTNGDFVTDLSGWTLSSSTPPVWDNGMMKMQSDGVTFSRADQSFVTEIGVEYKFKINKLVNGDNVQVKIGNGIGNSNVLNQTLSLVGKYTFTITPISTNTYIRIEDGSGSVGAYVSDISVKEITGQTTKASCPHILAEPQRTNLVTYSEDFSNSAWTKSNSTIATTTETVSPDGTENASKLTVIAVQYSGLYKTLDAASNKYSMSIFAKKGDKDWLYFIDGAGTTSVAWFNISDGTLGTITNGTATINNFGNGWYRCTYSDTNNNSNVYFQIGLADANNSNTPSSGGHSYIWGADKEVGSFPTSYIPTSGSTVTRNQDIFTRDGIGSLINSEEGVLFVESKLFEETPSADRHFILKGDASNYVDLYFKTSNQIQARINVGGSSTYIDTTFPIATPVFRSVALVWKTNRLEIWIDGIKAVEKVIFTSFASQVLSELNFDNVNGNTPFYGKVKQLQVYKTALTDEQLIQLTGTSGTDFYESYAEMASALTYTIQ